MRQDLEELAWNLDGSLPDLSMHIPVEQSCLLHRGVQRR